LNKYQIIEKLSTKFGLEEATLLTKYLLEDVSVEDRTNFSLLSKSVERLLNDEPLQYITGKAYFLDYIFYVNPSVLIPRPETEELVEWAKEVIKDYKVNSILEVGTGSGCIAIAIKDKASVALNAIDVSIKALEVAKQNAITYNCNINFIECNFLDEGQRNNLPRVDLIISNPPYITEAEKVAMLPNVLNHEPQGALFAVGKDPFVFYKHLAELGNEQNATVMCELNEYYVKEIVQLFESEDCSRIEVRNDMQGKGRMLMASFNRAIL
jgi:release factor glutamine methyltransferase